LNLKAAMPRAVNTTDFSLSLQRDKPFSYTNANRKKVWKS
jgi:hypothetical protein